MDQVRGCANDECANDKIAGSRDRIEEAPEVSRKITTDRMVTVRVLGLCKVIYLHRLEGVGAENTRKIFD